MGCCVVVLWGVAAVEEGVMLLWSVVLGCCLSLLCYAHLFNPLL